MALKQHIDAKVKAEAEETAAKPKLQQARPDSAYKLDAFIAQNPKLVESYHKMSKDELVYHVLMSRMLKVQAQQAVNEQVTQIAAQRPSLKAYIDDQQKAAEHVKATIGAARDIATIKSSREVTLEEVHQRSPLRSALSKIPVIGEPIRNGLAREAETLHATRKADQLQDAQHVAKIAQLSGGIKLPVASPQQQPQQAQRPRQSV